MGSAVGQGGLSLPVDEAEACGAEYSVSSVGPVHLKCSAALLGRH